MPRDPRYILPNSLQHVVDVVHRNQYLLCPSEEVNERFLGVLGRAQQKYDMTICAAVVLASHYHLLLRPRDGQHLADFMCFLKTNLAKEIGHRLRGLKGHFFARRYHASMVSEEPAAQMQILRYILSHGVKENLVDTVRQWPGVHCAAALIDGTVLGGRWPDRSSSCVPSGDTTDMATQGAEASWQAVDFSPLPCWQHLSAADWRRHVREMVDDIDHRAAVERRATGEKSMGVAAVLAQDPYFAPDEVEASPQPRFHTVDQQVLESLVEAWRHVLTAYALASEALRSGDRNAVFPPGMFPPALPFVPFGDAAGGDPPSGDPTIGVHGGRGQPA